MITTAIMQLIFKEPFFANLVLNMTRQYTTDVPTIGVNVTDSVNLYINPHFWQSLNLEQQVDILKHECYHVLNNHFARFKNLEPHIFDDEKNADIITKIKKMQEFRSLNISADVAINQYLPNIPKEMLMFDKDGNMIVEPAEIQDKDGKMIPNPNAGIPMKGSPVTLESLKKEIKDAKALEAMEYYYALLQQEKQKRQQNGQGQPQVGGTVDDHSMWAQGDQDEEYITEKVKAVVQKAAEATQRSAGSVPSDIQHLIEALNHKPKDWRQDLQKFVSKTSEILIESSRKQRHRRYGIQYPGNRIYPKLHLAVAIDTSGSIREEELNQFVAEIDRITKNNVKVTVIECDARVNNVYEFEPTRCLKNLKVTGRGGTAFQPAFDACKELDVDGLIYLTDGCNFEGDQLLKPKYPVMWALLKGYEKDFQYKWGYRTVVEVKEKTRR